MFCPLEMERVPFKNGMMNHCMTSLSMKHVLFMNFICLLFIKWKFNYWRMNTHLYLNAWKITRKNWLTFGLIGWYIACRAAKTTSFSFRCVLKPVWNSVFVGVWKALQTSFSTTTRSSYIYIYTHIYIYTYTYTKNATTNNSSSCVHCSYNKIRISHPH